VTSAEGSNGSGGAIATGCPFCRVMISDGLTERQSEERGTDVEVRDVSEMLLDSVKRGQKAPAESSS
jgi:Fe-S oxidoreductase